VTFEPNKIYCGDSVSVLKTFPDECIDCCVTSPPYWGLRQYFFDGAVIIKADLTESQKLYVLSELNKYGVRPKYGGKK
jgi:DNA modification methylase